MRVQPLRHPSLYPISFGIYKNTRITPYGKCTYGEYKKYNIQVYDDREDKAKLYYISDDKLRWVKSKLVFFRDGIRKIIRSNSNGM